jgi:hypothetical protein
MTVRLIDDRAELRENIRRLEALLNAEQAQSAETRVTALASLVLAQPSSLAAEAADKLDAFGDKADELVTTMRGRRGY